MDMNRRKLIGGLGLLIASPAIVRASSLMPVKVWKERYDGWLTFTGFDAAGEPVTERIGVIKRIMVNGTTTFTPEKPIPFDFRNHRLLLTLDAPPKEKEIVHLNYEINGLCQGVTAFNPAVTFDYKDLPVWDGYDPLR